MRKRMMWLGCVFAVMIVSVPIGYAQQGPAQRLNELIKAAQAEGELNLVAGGGTWGEAEGVRIIQDALNKKYGLNIRIRYAAGPAMPVMTGRVIETRQAGVKSDTDILVANARPVNMVLGKGVTRPYPWREVFPHVPGDTVEAEGQLIRFVDVFHGITYNTREIKTAEAPRRLQDVLNPKWKGKIASTPYASGLYFLASNRAWGYDKALEFVQALSRQIGGLIRCGEESRIASGEFLMLVKNCGNYGGDAYARQTGGPVGTVWEEDPSLIDSFYFVVPAHSAHPNLATLLVGFLMSKEGQDILSRVVGWSSASVEGTPAHKQYKEAEAKSMKTLRFTAASWRGEEGAILSKAATEFAKVLAGR
ncbi:MAG: extracellular solute-binding protein [Candidatus Tectomicrobia bacterium]|uniref:Extracellular solute-binding protein n=1 Tax=Tectimicrobiota bacterium TaxID=2528274 RepID=A0A932GRL5_UNCTE|nr:extracellular solute-binding protein [Candidatus Tectomicrobia bacterium]